MSFGLVLRLLGVFALILSAFVLIPIAAAPLLGEASMIPAFLPSLAAGLAFYLLQLFFRRLSGMDAKQNGKKSQLSIRGGFFFASLAWLLASAISCLPYLASGSIGSPSAAFFESMAGFTTTGSSVIPDLDLVPRSIILWRSLTQWLGGMGIVVLTVALFPLLGVGAFYLVRAEATGPSIDRIAPRISETAKILWLIYLLFTALLTALLALGGLSFFDAINHAFSTVASGGFSTVNDSSSLFSSSYLQWVLMVFMLMAAINFSLYHRLFTGSFKVIRQNSELKAYLLILLIAAALISIDLLTHGVYGSLEESIRKAGFQSASILSTTAYEVAELPSWPELSRTLIIALMFVGGSTGSTAGGIKVLRILVLAKLAGFHMRRLIEPRGVFSLRINKNRLQDDSLRAIGGFIYVYLLIILVLSLFSSAAGMDFATSFSTSLTVLGNVGLNTPGMNFSQLPDWLLWAYSFGMLLGRLEIYSVLVIFTPLFWKR